MTRESSLMDQLAKYIITHVQRDTVPGRIAKFRILEKTSGEFQDRGLMDRDEVIELLADDQRFFVWDNDGENIGGELEAVKVQGERFLRTDGQRLRADNVDELPEV
jgi:hypothetical protein